MGIPKRTIDLTEFNINIDDLLDVYKDALNEAGVETGLVESNLDVDSKGNVYKVSTTKDESKKGCSKCGKCDTEAKKQSGDIYHSNYTSGLGKFSDFMSPELEEDDDGIYVCEYCTELGYKKEYTPYLCDECVACETCSELESGDCSGCTFSSYRTGRLYSEELRNNGQEVPLDEENVELMLKFDTEVYDNVRRTPSESFSVLDHDHRY